MATFIGESRNKLDAKFRLSLPAKFRSQISEQTLVVMVEPKTKNCLYAFTSTQDYDKWVEGVFARDGGFDEHNNVHKRVLRLVKHYSEEVKIDSAYRVILNARQREEVGILDKDVVLVGYSDYFEIWDAKRWDDCSAELDGDDAVNSYF